MISYSEYYWRNIMAQVVPTVGDLFFTIRKINILTQVEFARRLRVVQSTVSKIEKDQFEDVPFKLISHLCREFKIHINCFHEANLIGINQKLINRIINPEFTVSGSYNHEIVRLIVNNLPKADKRIVSQKLKYHQEYFALQNIKFNEFFFYKLKLILNDKYDNALTSLHMNGKFKEEFKDLLNIETIYSTKDSNNKNYNYFTG